VTGENLVTKLGDKREKPSLEAVKEFSSVPAMPLRNYTAFVHCGCERQWRACGTATGLDQSTTICAAQHHHQEADLAQHFDAPFDDNWIPRYNFGFDANCELRGLESGCASAPHRSVVLMQLAFGENSPIVDWNVRQRRVVADGEHPAHKVESKPHPVSAKCSETRWGTRP
jgi:hypothetical protein